MVQLIKGVSITELKIIKHEKGNVYHALKKSELGFKEFGEAYFSTIKNGEFKGWKKHQKMILNIIVPEGSIKFFFVKEDNYGNVADYSSIELSKEKYCRLTVEPDVWMGFKGTSEGANLLLNIASMEHEPSEAVTRDCQSWNDLFAW